ncbi:MAG TPA: serine hydrolase, partial [Stellaceae bacterium]|nr:serine hydrolase [Stellaceae bacterium]
MFYFPPSDPEWARCTPEAAGLDGAAIAAAARYAAEHETPWRRDLAHMIATDFGEEPPWNEALGPVRPRGGPNGLVLRRGHIVAEWGDSGQIDMTFSVAKSYLSILAGLAVDRGLIRDVDEPVCRTPNVDWGEDGGFAPPHNHRITWHHLLQQTSEWEG